MAFRLAVLPIAIILALAPGCGDDSESGFVIIGSWKGQLMQTGLEPFVVTATIEDLDDPASNTVHYTGIDCGGNWTFLGREGDSFRFREVIDRGAGGDCKGKGIVTLTPSGQDNLEYEFRGGGIESRGVLSRTG